MLFEFDSVVIVPVEDTALPVTKYDIEGARFKISNSNFVPAAKFSKLLKSGRIQTNTENCRGTKWIVEC